MVLVRNAVFQQFGQTTSRGASPFLRGVFASLVDSCKQFADILEGVEPAPLHGPVPVRWVLLQLWQTEQHAQLREGVLVAVRLQLLNHPLKSLLVNLGAGKDLQILLPH